MKTVAELLADSTAAHLRYRQAAGRTDKDGRVISPPNDIEAEAAIREALSARLEAHALDPDHADAAWIGPKATHDDLVKFYDRYLAQVEAEKGTR